MWASFSIWHEMKLIIKNMVCRHCVGKARSLLEDLGLTVVSIELGAAVVSEDLDAQMLSKVVSALHAEGFELIQSRDAEIVENIKHSLIELSRRGGGERENLQSFFASQGNLSYASLSRIFSEIEGRSIENYYVNLRIERVKELIKYQQLSLSEIADEMGYSSVAHLSRQFKQLTGLTPTQFRMMGRREELPNI